MKSGGLNEIAYFVYYSHSSSTSRAVYDLQSDLQLLGISIVHGTYVLFWLYDEYATSLCKRYTIQGLWSEGTFKLFC